MRNVIEIAKDMAIFAHLNQKRKYSGAPYIEHPAQVVEMLKSIPGVSDNMIAAAWLHDTVEDCNVTFEDIERECGTRVAQYVADLTDVSRPEDGNRAQRKAIDRLHSSKICASAQTIKLADLIDNTCSILRHVNEGNKEAINFAKTYFPEKRMLLEVLQQGDFRLWALADAFCKEYEILNAQWVPDSTYLWLYRPLRLPKSRRSRN